MNSDAHPPACCRVCGLAQVEPPWGPDGKSPTHAICDCCGAEFGYEDSHPDAVAAYRAAWLSRGMPWFNPRKKPAGWNAGEQLKRVMQPGPGGSAAQS